MSESAVQRYYTREEFDFKKNLIRDFPGSPLEDSAFSAGNAGLIRLGAEIQLEPHGQKKKE